MSEQEQEHFFEAIWADETMSDADKADWLYECAKEYWQMAEREHALYAARDADATGWAEQATRSAGAINRLVLALERIREHTKAGAIELAYHEAVITLDEQATHA
jgi:hypothetical protein